MLKDMAKYCTRNLAKVYGAWRIPAYSTVHGANSM